MSHDSEFELLTSTHCWLAQQAPMVGGVITGGTEQVDGKHSPTVNLPFILEQLD